MSKNFHPRFLGAAETCWAVSASHLVYSTQARCAGPDPDHARRHSKKDCGMAHRLSGGRHLDGWHYDLMLIVMNLVIILTNGGKYSLWAGVVRWQSHSAFSPRTFWLGVKISFFRKVIAKLKTV